MNPCVRALTTATATVHGQGTRTSGFQPSSRPASSSPTPSHHHRGSGTSGAGLQTTRMCSSELWECAVLNCCFIGLESREVGFQASGVWEHGLQPKQPQHHTLPNPIPKPHPSEPNRPSLHLNLMAIFGGSDFRSRADMSAPPRPSRPRLSRVLPLATPKHRVIGKSRPATLPKARRECPR